MQQLPMNLNGGGLQITIWEGWGMQDSQQEKSYCGRLLKRIEKNK